MQGISTHQNHRCRGLCSVHKSLVHIMPCTTYSTTNCHCRNNIAHACHSVAAQCRCCEHDAAFAVVCRLPADRGGGGGVEHHSLWSVQRLCAKYLDHICYMHNKMTNHIVLSQQFCTGMPLCCSPHECLSLASIHRDLHTSMFHLQL